MNGPAIHHPSCPYRHDLTAACLCVVTDPRAELLAVEDLAQIAYGALDNEAEGEFRNAVVELHTRAAALLHLVSTW